jgi:hypothetical protein
MIYPDTVTPLNRRFMVIGEVTSYTDIVCYHEMSSSKWWNDVPSPTPTARFFKEQMRAFVSKS